MRLIISPFLIIALMVFSAAVANAQVLDAPPINEILDKAEAQRDLYMREFRNLIATEDRSFEIYNHGGGVREKRDVRSTFIVYQLSKDAKVATEFRDVLAVDGKPVENNEKRAVDFFKLVEQSANVDAEASNLHAESLRYDLEMKVTGFTLFQSIVLEGRLRPYFSYEITGKETVEGHETYVVAFKQTKFCPFIFVNAKRTRGIVPLSLAYNVGLKSNVDYNEQLSGKLYIDIQTFQVWREQRKMTVQPEGYSAPATLDENDYAFTSSPFGILTPKRIVHTQYAQIPSESRSIKWCMIVYDYDKFTKPDVTVTQSDSKDKGNSQKF